MGIADDIERLAQLAEQGLISWSQFEEQRDGLLAGRISRTEILPSEELPTRPDHSATAPDPAPRAQDSPTTVRAGPPEDPIPSDVGAYRLDLLLGKGGMGAVYRGQHRVKPGLFAVKVLSPSLAAEPGFRRRFEREARVGLELDHPNIVRVADFIVDGTRLALIMEYVEGETLAARIRRHAGPMPWPEAAAVFRQMLEAMAYAHSKGVVHRDIKPGNVMLNAAGQVKITDFGVAHLEGASGTRTKMVLGTVEYMAPETFTTEQPPSPRSDVYSLGMTLYKMVTGRLPYAPRSPKYMVMKLKELGEMPSPRVFAPGTPDSACRLIELATAKDPERRASSCAELLALLDAAARSEGTPVAGATMPRIGGRAPGGAVTPRVPIPAVRPAQDALTRPWPPGRPGPARAAPAPVPVAGMVSADSGASPAPTGRPAGPSARTLGAALVVGLFVLAALVLTSVTSRVENPDGALAPKQIDLEPVEQPVAEPTPEPTPEPVTAAPRRTVKAAPAPPPADEPAVGAILSENAPLRVTAVPGARVLLGTRPIGEAGPGGATLHVEPGTHRIRFVCRDEGGACDPLVQRSVVQKLEVPPEGLTHRVDFVELNAR